MGINFVSILLLLTQSDTIMIDIPDTDLQELQRFLRFKQDELATASFGNTTHAEQAALYKQVKEVQYRILLLQNKLTDTSQVDSGTIITSTGN